MTVLRNRLLNGRPYLLSTGAPAYATSFTITAPSTITVGSPSPISVAPVGGVWNGQTVTPTSTIAGTFSPASAVGSGSAALVFQFTASATGSGTINASASGLTSGGAASVTAVSAGTPGPMSQVFSLSNWGSAASAVNHKRGVWFKKGDVPTGSVPTLSSVAAQFYGLAYWSDGSLRSARLLLRDTPLAAAASRSYTMTATTGTLAGATAVTGNAGLAASIAGHDVKVSFANVRTWDCSSDNGNYATLGSGAFAASLTSHAATSTRWTQLTTGPVADVWQGWGMAADASSGAADAHLKVNWYVTRWKNADGTTLSLQVGAVVALDWWSVPNKYFLCYDAALADGATAIVSYPGVRHHYHGQWLACVNDGSLNAGTAPWIGAAQPTLHCSFDRDYAVATGLVPPLDTAKRPTPKQQFAYVPLQVVADPDTISHTQSHRPAIDAAGGYNGRGLVPVFDADAFMAGTPQAYAVARTNALSGLGVPFHYRSNRQRTRPGEAADMANTSIPLLMAPKPASYSDFTAQGLPIAVNAYTGNTSDLTGKDGFMWQAGVQDPNNPGKQLDFTWAAGAFNGWSLSLDAGHAVSYCYFMALVSGDEWLLEAELDLAMNLAHQTIWTYHQQRQLIACSYNSAAPTDTYTGLLGQWQDNNPRYMGWSQQIQGHGFGLLPTDHIFYGCSRALMAHQGDYIEGNLNFLPSDFQAAGICYPEGVYPGVFSPWMGAFQAMGAYMHYLINEDARWKRLGDWCATWSVTQATAGRWYWLDVYRTLNRAKNAPWNASTNPSTPVVQQPCLEMFADYKASTNLFTVNNGAFWSENRNGRPPLTNGDPVTLCVQTDGGNNGVVPAGANDGQVFYLVNVTAGQMTPGPSPSPPTFQLAATIGGAPVSFQADTAGCNIAYAPASASIPQVATSAGNDATTFPYIPTWDNYVPIHVSVIMLAYQAGNAAATAAIVNGALAFTAPMDGVGGYYSAFDAALATS